MLLRRFIQHVKAQNWIAVGLDFFIVVMGVFIGIQVSNWNAARAERGIAARHLTEIAEDLQAHLERHDELFNCAVRRIAAVDLLYDRAFETKLPDELTLSSRNFDLPARIEVPEGTYDNIMGWVNLVCITVSARSGYESLISSGHLSLIENRDLARHIQAFYGQYDDLLSTQELFRTFRNDGVRDMYAYGISPFDSRPLNEVVSIAREHEAFAAYLRATREWAILHAYLLATLRDETEGLLREIRTELGSG